MKYRTGLIATKIGNSSYFSDNGKVIPVTLLRVDECIVSNIKTLEKDGYTSLQLASIDGKSDVKKINKPQQKLFANIKTNPKKIIKEFKVDPEKAHDISLSFLEFIYKSFLGKIFHKRFVKNGIKQFDVLFDNPVGLAAGFDKNADYLNFITNTGTYV